MQDTPHRYPATLLDCLVDFLASFEGAVIHLEMEFAGRLNPPMPFVFSLSGYDGTLTLAAGACPTQVGTIGRFFDAVLKELPA